MAENSLESGKPSLNDFSIIKVIGKGVMGKVIIHYSNGNGSLIFVGVVGEAQAEWGTLCAQVYS